MKKEVYDKDSFVQKAKRIHGDKFDYSKFNYINAKTKSIITCLIHGDFKQNADKHFNSKYACPECTNLKKKENAIGKKPVKERESVSKEEYLIRFTEKYGNKFDVDLSAYRTITDGIVKIKCSIHGESDYNPRALLISKYGCKFCADTQKSQTKTKTYDNFLEKAKEVHGDTYLYSSGNEETYVNRKSIVTVICKKHGAFKKKAQKHLSGQGCFKCKIDELVKDGRLTGYSSESFENNNELRNKEAFVYYIKVEDKYKIGITINLYDRMKSIKSLSKTDVEIVDVLKTTLMNAYQIEQYILGEYDDYRTYRRWSTELFTENVLKEKSLKDICQSLHLSNEHS